MDEGLLGEGDDGYDGEFTFRTYDELVRAFDDLIDAHADDPTLVSGDHRAQL